MVHKNSTSKQNPKQTSKPKPRAKPRPKASTKLKAVPTYNAFTKSYTFRHVVHAARIGIERTLCGRVIFKDSKILFDPETEGSCKKCIDQLKIEKRVHPGWNE